MKIRKHWHFILVLIGLIAISVTADSMENESMLVVVKTAVGAGMIFTIIFWIIFMIDSRKNRK